MWSVDEEQEKKKKTGQLEEKMGKGKEEDICSGAGG